jgi:hypothetical protein
MKSREILNPPSLRGIPVKAGGFISFISSKAFKIIDLSSLHISLRDSSFRVCTHIDSLFIQAFFQAIRFSDVIF